MAANKKTRKEKVIEVLNKARSMELFAIHQYMNQHYNLSDKDYGELAANMKLIAIDEMRHAEDFAERIKELGGEPTAQKDGSVKGGQAVPVIYEDDVNLEDNTIEAYNRRRADPSELLRKHLQPYQDAGRHLPGQNRGHAFRHRAVQGLCERRRGRIKSESIWLIPRISGVVRWLIAAICMIPTGATNGIKFPPEPSLRICPTTGAARSAEPPKKASAA